MRPFSKISYPVRRSNKRKVVRNVAEEYPSSQKENKVVKRMNDKMEETNQEIKEVNKKIEEKNEKIEDMNSEIRKVNKEILECKLNLLKDPESLENNIKLDFFNFDLGYLKKGEELLIKNIEDLKNVKKDLKEEVISVLKITQISSTSKIHSELDDFWNSLPNLSPNKKNIIQFPISPFFFPSNMEGSMYIREAYKDLFQIICKNLEVLPEQKRNHRIAIIGTPGIGKSFFLFYILWRLSQLKFTQTVILHRQNENGLIFVFQKSGCWSTNKDGDIIQLLYDKATWYLTDALDPTPMEAKAITILVTSPKRKLYKKFLKYSGTAELHYLPVWTLEELHMARGIFSMSKKQVEKNYNLIGGIPRFIFERNFNINEIISEAIIMLKMDKFYDIATGDVAKEDEISHLVVHFDVNSTYDRITLQFGSKYIAEKALKRFQNIELQKLKYFFAFAESSPLLSTVRENLFKAHAHQVLAAGGNFAIRSLDAKETRTSLQLEKRERENFFEISKCKRSEKYYVPWNPNYPCIDSCIPGVGYFQITVSLSHPLPKQKMMEIMKASKNNILYFVVPRSIYADFPLQNLVGKEDEENGLLQGLHQFALLLDIERTLEYVV